MNPSAEASGTVAAYPTIQGLQALIVDYTGNARLLEKDSAIVEKAERRRNKLKLPSLDAYLAFLRDGQDCSRKELDALVSRLLVGETSFFRHPEHFEALRQTVLPACLERNRGTRKLRIWSAGCANGAEAYSLAITVGSVLGKEVADWNVTIVASDVSRDRLEEAKAGVYSDWTLRNLAGNVIPKYLSREGEDWRIRKEHKSLVRFVEHNLIKSDIPSLTRNIFLFDIVFCRNVMIYFDSETTSTLMKRLGGVLADDGYLFVAPADFPPERSPHFVSERIGDAIVLRPHSAQSFAGRETPRRLLRPGPGSRAFEKKTAASAARASEKKRGRAKETARPRGGPLRRSRPPAAGEPRKPPHDIEAVITSADKGEWADAAMGCEAILGADPCNVAARYYYGLVLQSAGATAAAEQELRRAIYLERGFALAHYQLGDLRREALDLAGSRKSFRNALAALDGIPDEQPVSPCGRVAAAELRELVAQQLERLATP